MFIIITIIIIIIIINIIIIIIIIIWCIREDRLLSDNKHIDLKMWIKHNKLI